MTWNIESAPRHMMTRLLGAASIFVIAGSLASPAFAQDDAAQAPLPQGEGAAQDPTAENEEGAIVVTGFRNSLRAAIGAKREDTGIVDVIVAEDIADFPDTNLAESLQRIPGVAIDRDAGEGRQITVRGLGGDFTRVRLNQLEALATTGGTDSSGGANRSRAFDFNIFASELFNRLTVRKSASAEVDEGSLGATVDLQTARPFDYEGFVMSASAQMGYNDLSGNWDPRGAFLVCRPVARRPLRRAPFGRLQPAQPARGGLQLGPLGRRQQRRRLLLAGRNHAPEPDRWRRQLWRQSQHSGLHRAAAPAQHADQRRRIQRGDGCRGTSIPACRATAA